MAGVERHFGRDVIRSFTSDREAKYRGKSIHATTIPFDELVKTRTYKKIEQMTQTKGQ
jgi:hypothetical protein